MWNLQLFLNEHFTTILKHIILWCIQIKILWYIQEIFVLLRNLKILAVILHHLQFNLINLSLRSFLSRFGSFRNMGFSKNL